MAQVSIIKTKIGRWCHDGKGEFPVEHEYFVYRGEKLIRVCPSIGMAREVAAGLA